jgi:replicative DNA helicase
LAIQAAHSTAKNLGRRSVAYLSLEMSSEELATVLACRDAKVPRDKVANAWETLIEADRQALHQLAREWQKSGSMWLRDSTAGPQTVAHVGAWIRSQRARHGALELVVIDYLGLIKGSNPKQFLTDRTTEITSTLKQIALAEGVAIILLSQLTREGRKPPRSADGKIEADPVPRVEDLYGGGSIEADADGVVMLHPIDREGLERRVDCIIAKNRRGPFPITLPMWFYGKWQHFQDAASDADVSEEVQERKKRMDAPPSETENVF